MSTITEPRDAVLLYPGHEWGLFSADVLQLDAGADLLATLQSIVGGYVEALALKPEAASALRELTGAELREVPGARLVLVVNDAAALEPASNPLNAFASAVTAAGHAVRGVAVVVALE